jgi:hypothetical protein
MAKIDEGSLAEMKRIVIRFRELRTDILQTDEQIQALTKKSAGLVAEYSANVQASEALFDTLTKVYGPGALDPATLEWVKADTQ